MLGFSDSSIDSSLGEAYLAKSKFIPSLTRGAVVDPGGGLDVGDLLVIRA